MKVLISYASAGSGHRKAAQGIYNYLKQKKPYIDIGIVNALEKTNPLFEYTYIVGYNFLIRQGLGLWRLAYWITDVRFLRPLTRLMASIVNLLNCGNFIRFLIQENPDFVIATHFLPLEISNHLKNTQKIKSKVIAVITDFGVHSFWLSKGTDIYIVASEFTKKELVRQGVEEKRIKDLGIPVDSKFLTPYDRNCLSKKLGIDASRFTVLIMTGSFGVGPLEDIVKLLYKEVQILLAVSYTHLTLPTIYSV